MTLQEAIKSKEASGAKLKRNERGKVEYRIKHDHEKYLIHDIDMPNRGKNALLRNGVRTVGDVLDFFAGGRNTKLKGVGDKTLQETKDAIIEWNWSMMTQKEQEEYLKTLFV